MSRLLVSVLALLALAGCGNRGTPEPASVAEVTEAKATDERDERPARIYYDLTKYGWYARAEPMVVEQQHYGPRGAPLRIPLAKLRLMGNYQGVDFYVLHGEKEPPNTLYVPVYEGFWLPFIAARSAGD